MCRRHNLRWAFVFQRPQHLMIRFAEWQPAVFFEEPIFDDAIDAPCLDVRQDGLVTVAVPRLPPGLSGSRGSGCAASTAGFPDCEGAYRAATALVPHPNEWAFTGHLVAAATVYDCMDELSDFVDAPKEMRSR